MPLLEVTDLRTYFTTDAGVARAVDGVSLHVGPGETLGIVGESGCGKTVTALTVLGLIPSPPGEIVSGSSVRFDDEELLEAKPARLRQIRGNEISMIFQEPMTSLNPVLTVGGQIEEVLRLHRGLSKREARAVGVALLTEVGIPEPDHRFDCYPHQMSGGMLQRVMIAMALSCEPRLLIADEPTTALDVTIQAQILDLLVSLKGRHGMALLLITHDLGVIAEVCDRVLVMYGGQIVEGGDHGGNSDEPPASIHARVAGIASPYRGPRRPAQPHSGYGAESSGLAAWVPLPRPLLRRRGALRGVGAESVDGGRGVEPVGEVLACPSR